MKLIRKSIVALFLVVSMLLPGGQSGTPTQVQAAEKDLFMIMGNGSTCLSQLINYYTTNNKYPAFYVNSDAPTIYAFCQMYIDEANSEGVKPEVAFAQAMKETGFLRFKGDVSIEQYNFAGIGATGNGVKGNSFPSVRIGIRAQIQHLKAYASTQPLNNEVVDPRYKYVTKGTAPYVEWLGIKENPTGHGWASDPNYGKSIVNDYISKLYNGSRYMTWYQGKDYSAVYDPDYYLSHNADVAKACGGSSDTLIHHFITYGMNEGRQAKTSFNVISYKKRYKDLRSAYANDLKAYYLHYVNCGQREGRVATGEVTTVDPITSYKGVDYSSVYNYDYYTNRYSDVKNAYGDDDIAVLAHFVKSGMNEGRQATITFNVSSYKNRYVDLRKAYGSDLKNYYMHYVNYGRREGRTGTGYESNVINPVTTYEGIDYSAVYDFKYYIEHNPDVLRAYGYNDIGVLRHFVLCGMNEGRQAKETFNAIIYKNNYQDLQRAYGNNLKSYYIHYVKYGKAEGRQAMTLRK